MFLVCSCLTLYAIFKLTIGLSAYTSLPSQVTRSYSRHSWCCCLLVLLPSTGKHHPQIRGTVVGCPTHLLGTGLRDMAQQHKSALAKEGVTNNKAPFSSHPFLAPLHSHQSVSDSSPQVRQPVNVNHSHNAASLSAASDAHMSATDQQHQTEEAEFWADPTDGLKGTSSIRAVSISPAMGAAPSSPGVEAEPGLQTPLHVHSEVQMSQAELPQQLPSQRRPEFADSTAGKALANAASSIRQSQLNATSDAAKAAEVDDAQDPSSIDQESCLDGAEQQDEHHLESPGRFAEAQFVLLQQRQHQLQSQRMAGLPLASKSQPSHVTQLGLRPQDSSLSESALSEQQSRASSPFRPVPQHIQHTQHAQHGTVDGEEVANSPVVLFSPGGPYSHKSSWYKDAAATQVFLTCSPATLSCLGSVFSASCMFIACCHGHLGHYML